MNNFSCTGRFVANPEVTTLASGTKKVRFSLAIENKYSKNKEVIFADFEAWDSGAEFIAKHFEKGDNIIVGHAELRQDKWQDQEGKNRSKLYFRINEFEFPRGNKRKETVSENSENGELVGAGATDSKEPF